MDQYVETHDHKRIPVRLIRAAYSKRTHDGYAVQVNTGDGIYTLDSAYSRPGQRESQSVVNALYDSPGFDVKLSYSR